MSRRRQKLAEKLDVRFTIEKPEQTIQRMTEAYIRYVTNRFADIDPDRYRKLMFAPADANIPLADEAFDGVTLTVCMFAATLAAIELLKEDRTILSST